MRVPIAFGLCAFVLIGCSRSAFKGYKEIGDELYFRLNALGESDHVPADTDSVLMRVRIAKLGDPPGSLFSTERWYGLKDSASSFIHVVFGRLHEGDSASVIAKGAHVPWSKLGANNMQRTDTVWVGIELSMRAVRTCAEARAIARERILSSRTVVEEEREINAYLAKSSSLWKQYMGVTYVLDGPLEGSCPLVRSGDLVTIGYTASTLTDPHPIDDTYQTGQPLSFRLGDPGQVIKGIEVAVHLLPKGGKGRFIIPSALAFGPAGSSSGIVPPWTPLLYRVEVLDATTVPSNSKADSTAASR